MPVNDRSEVIIPQKMSMRGAQISVKDGRKLR